MERKGALLQRGLYEISRRDRCNVRRYVHIFSLPWDIQFGCVVRLGPNIALLFMHFGLKIPVETSATVPRAKPN